jgi:hypothetical protein
MDLELTNFRCWTDKQFQTPLNGCVLINGVSGQGKCHGKDTPIIMYDGMIKMVQNIEVGDKIMGDDSKPRTVSSLARGREKLYKVKQSTGDNYVVNESHILSLQKSYFLKKESDCYVLHYLEGNYLQKLKFSKSHFFTNEKAYEEAVKFGNTILNKKEIIDIPLTEYLKLSKIVKHILKGYKVGVNFPSKDTPSDSYTFGLFLCSDDASFIKKIPLVYKINDRITRLKLLAGIIDMNGILNNDRYEIYHKNKDIINDISFLCRSLGISVNVQMFNKNFNGLYKIIISGSNLNEIPVLSEIKKIKHSKKLNSSMTSFIKVIPLDIDEYYGFEIDGNHRYLLGDFTVTHNTTILNSILWAITGKLKKVSTFGKKFCKAELSFGNDVKIKRSYGPNLLEVFYENNNYTGDEAQKIINKIFGNHFDTISYIEQDNYDSFVFKSPSEKFEFLEELLLKEHGIDKIVLRVKNEINRVKELSISEQTKLNTLQNFLKNYKYSVCEELIIGGCKITFNNFNSVTEKVKKGLEIAEKNLKTSETNLLKFEKNENIKNRLNQFLYEKDELLKKYSLESLNDLEIKQNFYKKNKDYVALNLKISELSEKYKNYKNIRDDELKIFSNFTKPDDIDNEIKIKNKQLYNYKKLLEIEKILLSDEKCEDIDKEVVIYKSKLEDLQKSLKYIEESSKIYSCPSCSSKLLLENGSLIKYVNCDKHIDDLNLSELKKDIKKCEKKIEELNHMKILNDKNIENYNEIFSLLEESLKSDEWCEIEDYIAKLYKIQKILNDPTLENIENELKDANNKLCKIDISCVNEFISEEDFLKIVQDISLIKDANSRLLILNSNIESCEKEYKPFNISRDDIEKKIDDYNQKIKLYKKNLEDLTLWERKNSENEKFLKLQDDINTTEKSCSGLIERLKGLVKLKDCIKESEQKCIEEFINSLNSHAKVYIEEMFPDKDICVLLKTTKKEKISLNFEVNYNQMSNCDLSIFPSLRKIKF